MALSIAISCTVAEILCVKYLAKHIPIDSSKSVFLSVFLIHLCFYFIIILFFLFFIYLYFFIVLCAQSDNNNNRSPFCILGAKLRVAAFCNFVLRRHVV